MLTPIHPKTREALREAIRSVHQMAGISLHGSNETDRPIAIGVTSPQASEGKTTVALALASSLAEDLDAEVALVDADAPLANADHRDLAEVDQSAGRPKG